MARASCVPDFDWLDDVPGPPAVAWLVLAAVIARARVGARPARPDARRVDTSHEQARSRRRDETRARSSGRADEAEAAGEFEKALRLRFRAGLLRLDARGAIVYRPSISTREVSRKLRSEDFDALALTFDDVVYGGRAAEDADVEEARSRWRRRS